MLPEPQISTDLKLEPIPPYPTRVRRLMLATTMLVDGVVETMPEKWHPFLEHSLVMPAAGVIVAGTQCKRPLLLREVNHIAQAVERDAIIIRAADGPANASFDLILHGVERPFCGYRVWMPQPTGCAWLIPVAGEQSFFRLDPLGLELTSLPPFCDDVDRYRGLKFGAEFLSIAVQGWF